MVYVAVLMLLSLALDVAQYSDHFWHNSNDTVVDDNSKEVTAMRKYASNNLCFSK